ncbi:MAG: HEAT repeat domain-containing protein [Planctomycetota bacterium]|jgi:hypothetical protein
MNYRFLALSIILSGLLICAGMVAGGMLVRSRPSASPRVDVNLPEKFISGDGSAMVAVIEPGRMIYLDNSGQLFDIVFPKSGEPEISDIYSITYAPKRHASAPSSRSVHGYYLDSVSAERKNQREVARRSFLDAAQGRNLRLALDAAERLAELGEHPFLQEQLGKPGYAGPRAAALALGKRGYMETVPILIPLLGDMNLDIRAAAAEYMRKISGKDFITDIQLQTQDAAMKKYTDWWEEKNRK